MRRELILNECDGTLRTYLEVHLVERTAQVVNSEIKVQEIPFAGTLRWRVAPIHLQKLLQLIAPFAILEDRLLRWSIKPSLPTKKDYVYLVDVLANWGWLFPFTSKEAVAAVVFDKPGFSVNSFDSFRSRMGGLHPEFRPNKLMLKILQELQVS